LALSVGIGPVDTTLLAASAPAPIAGRQRLCPHHAHAEAICPMHQGKHAVASSDDAERPDGCRMTACHDGTDGDLSAIWAMPIPIHVTIPGFVRLEHAIESCTPLDSPPFLIPRPPRS
jgi:hypothetical protein